jgi:CBS domain-containing protein
MEVAMKVKDCMCHTVELVSPDSTIRNAARMMADIDAGILPVSDGDRLVGVITDRDIAIRGVGKGLSPDATVSETMTQEVRYCFEDDDVEDVLDNMADLQVRRLPVVNHDKRLVGIVSISDLSVMEKAEAGKALRDISRPSSLHSQSL